MGVFELTILSLAIGFFILLTISFLFNVLFFLAYGAMKETRNKLNMELSSIQEENIAFKTLMINFAISDDIDKEQFKGILERIGILNQCPPEEWDDTVL